MFLTRTLSIRWIWFILFGLTTFAGDALHWIPGVQCCAHRHLHTADDGSEEVVEHHHHGHAHHHHHHAVTKPASKQTAARVVSECANNCSICRYLALQNIVAHVKQSEISAPHEAAFFPLPVSICERDLPRYSAPRGPPALSA